MSGRNSMRKIRECLRLRFESGLSQSQCSRSLGIGRGSVQTYWQRFDVSGLPWAQAREISEETIPESINDPDQSTAFRSVVCNLRRAYNRRCHLRQALSQRGQTSTERGIDAQISRHHTRQLNYSNVCLPAGNFRILWRFSPT